MVFAWILSSRRTYRKKGASHIIFRDDIRERRQLCVERKEVSEWLTELERLQEVGGEVGARTGSSDEPDSILALAWLEPAFRYDHTKELDAYDRAQYCHWIAQPTVDAQDLWFFTVMAVAPLPAPVASSLHCRRTVSKTFRVMDEQAAQALTEDLDQAGWANPDLMEGQNLQLCIALPDAFAELLRHGRLHRIAVPSPMSRNDFKTPQWFKKMLLPGLTEHFERTSDARAHDHPERVAFMMSEAGQLADDIRGVLNGRVQSEALIPWLVKLQHLSDTLDSGNCSSRRRRIPTKAVIQMLLFSELLRNAGNLKEAIRSACRLCLPADVYKSVVDNSERFLSETPDATHLSRFRLSMDTALMVHYRVENMLAASRPARFFRYLTWDSSPQFHRDYEMTVVESVSRERLPGALEVMHTVVFQMEKSFDELTDDEDDTLRNVHISHLAFLGGILTSHTLPAVLIGFGASSFPCKLAALVHGMRLEHMTHRSLEKWCKEFLCVLSDDGTERLLHSLRPCNMESLCPHFVDTPQAVIEQIIAQATGDTSASDQGGNDFDMSQAPGFRLEVDELDLQPPLVDFTFALGFSGVHHVLDNATKAFAEVVRTCLFVSQIEQQLELSLHW